MSKQDQWREVSPRGLCTTAKDFLRVANDSLRAHTDSLPEHTRNMMDMGMGSPPSMAVYYNFLHASELALKAYLLQVNAASLKELRGPSFGHDICRLLSESIKHGLLSLCELDRRQISELHLASSLSRDKRLEYFRYELIPGEAFPKIGPVSSAAEILVLRIGKLELKTAERPSQ